MAIYSGPFFKYIKYCLLIFGLWPYQSINSKRISNFILGVFAISSIIPMALGLRQKTSTDIVVFSETMASTIIIFGALVQCITLYFRTHLVRELFEKIHIDWKKISDPNEILILRTFFRQGKSLAMLFMVSSISAYTLFAILTYTKLVHDKQTLHTESQFFPYYSNQLIISESKKNLQRIIHGSCAIFYGITAYSTVMTTYICSVKHVCGMYAIVGYRLKNLIKSNGNIDFMDNNDIVRKLLEIVVKHRETIEGTRLIAKIYGTNFFIVESCLLISVALLIFDIQYNLNDLRSVLKILLIVISFIVYMFQVHHGGEEIITFSNYVHSSIYSVEWFKASIKVKKLLLMILQRTCKTDVVQASIMTLSLQNFVKVIKISWSLAMILIGKNGLGSHQTHVITLNKTAIQPSLEKIL